MIHLSAFADEISADLNEQVDVLKSEGISHIELRSVWGTNVLDLSKPQIIDIQRTLQQHNIQVAALGSPIGKVAIDSNLDQHLERFERAILAAKAFDTPYIRLFSFYAPSQSLNTHQASDPAQYREQVLTILKTMTRSAGEENVILLHENEKDIYGDTIARNVDLLESINDEHFRSVLDPANYLQCQQEPYPAAYEATQKWLAYVHVKDVRADGTLAVAGDGQSRWPELLQRLRSDGYDGILALEPHLAAAGKYQGFSGPELFKQASQALQRLLRAMDWPYA